MDNQNDNTTVTEDAAVETAPEATEVIPEVKTKKELKKEKKAAKKAAKKSKGAPVPADGIAAEDGIDPAVPVVLTRKELKKQRKEIKKHKKEVAKEAKRHSAKRTKAENFWLGFIMIVVIVSMLVCGVFVYKSYKNLTSGAAAETTTASDSASSGSTSTGGSTTGSSNAISADAPANEPASGTSGDVAADAANADLSTPAGVVAYYKAAHAKALSSAKSVTRTYDNTVNYKEVLDIGNKSAIAAIAKTLMGQFLKENTEAVNYSGGDIAANFPPAGGNSNGLTADMVSTATCTEDGGNYIIKIAINSTDDAPDTGDKTQNLVTIVNEKQVTDAAGSMVSLEGLKNEYVGANITATVDKATGNLTALETDVPSYMCFSKASVAIISVDNCRIGLEYQQKWTVAY